MWTVEITNIKKNKFNFDVTVSFLKDGVVVGTEILQNLNPASDALAWARQKVKMYQDVDAFDTSPLIGVVDLTPVPLTKEQQYLQKKTEVEILKREVDLGLKPQSDLDTLVAEAITFQ